MTEASDYLNIALTSEQEASIKTLVDQTIPTTIYTNYLVIGDEPPASIMTVDLQTYMTPQDFEKMSNNLRFMPRSKLGPFLTEHIQPIVDPLYFDIIKKAIINLFNKVNVEEVNKRNIDPWKWETQKTEALYTSQDNPEIQAETYLQYLQPVPPTKNQELENEIMAAYIALPPIADPIVEVRRQAGIKGLLSLGEYEEAKNIIEAYRNADSETVKVLTTVEDLGARG